ncbi:MAG: hypothetical protein ACI945_001562 [Pseudohongiellaceae bacterium]
MLEKTLPANAIDYVFLGKELGPCSKDPEYYHRSGQVQFVRLKKSALFEAGLKHLQGGLSEGLNVARLCAEKDPAECHRSLLVSHYFCENFETDIQHINHDGGLESQQRLIDIQSVKADLLTPAEESSAIAYERQLKQTSYRK